ncbi:hypothetical protein DITRI_Ditri01bG0012700 [Diplodiscus trichospermus]
MIKTGLTAALGTSRNGGVTFLGLKVEIARKSPATRLPSSQHEYMISRCLLELIYLPKKKNLALVKSPCFVVDLPAIIPSSDDVSMKFLAKLSSKSLRVEADRKALLQTESHAFNERDLEAAAQLDQKEQRADVGVDQAIPEPAEMQQERTNLEATAQLDREHRATKSKSFHIILVVFTFLGYVISRRKNRKLLDGGNIEGEQPDEEQQMLIGNAAAAEANPGIQQNGFEIEENRTITSYHDQAHSRRHRYSLEAKCNFGTCLALVNFLAEIPSAILEQKASEENHGNGKAKAKIPEYLLIAMSLSLVATLVCLVELVYKGRKEKITWSRSNGRIPWFYYPPPAINRPFGTFAEIIGLVCAIAQCIVSTINYSLSRRHHAAVQVPVMPTIFSFGVLCSRLMARSQMRSWGKQDVGSKWWRSWR